jgi:hypothetical protein
MILTRRKFIQALLAFACTGSASSGFAASLSSNLSVATKKQLLLVSSGNDVCIIDLRNGELIIKIPLGFPTHSFIRSPASPQKIWTVQRFANNEWYKTHQTPIHPRLPFKAAEIDLDSGTVSNEITTNSGVEFRGHGFFAPHSNVLFVTRVNLDKNEGYLTGYDVTSSDIAITSDIALGKTGLHECRLSNNGTKAYVAATGAVNLNPYSLHPKHKRFSDGGIVSVDLATSKILTHYVIPENEYKIGHFRVLNNGNIIATTSTDSKKGIPGNIYWGHTDAPELKPIVLPDTMTNKKDSEKFDIAVDEHNNIAAINDSVFKEIYLINTQTGKYIDKISFDAFAVSYDPYHGMFLVNGEKIALIDQHLNLHPEGVPDFSSLKGPFRTGHTLVI